MPEPQQMLLWTRGRRGRIRCSQHIILFFLLLVCGANGALRAIIGGVTRNNDPVTTAALVPKLVHLARQLFGTDDRFRVFIYEDSSSISARSGWLHALASTDAPVSYHYDTAAIVNSDLPAARRGRIWRLARARNTLVRLVDERYSRTIFPYVIMLDMDGVCGGTNRTLTFDIDVFRHVFTRISEWDALGFIFNPYWDLLALTPKHIATDFTTATRFFTERPENEFVPVDSMFMMLGIYKRAAMANCTYDGPICEHIPFIECMRRRNGARVRVFNRCYCVGDSGWRPMLVRPATDVAAREHSSL